MKFDHSEKVLDLMGDECVEDGKTLTFRSLVFIALNNTLPGEQIGAEQKARSFHTCEKLFKGNRVDLTVEERTLIKERGALILGTMYYGRLADWIEGKTQQFVTDEECDEEEDDDESSADLTGVDRSEERTSSDETTKPPKSKSKSINHNGRVTQSA